MKFRKQSLFYLWYVGWLWVLLEVCSIMAIWTREHWLWVFAAGAIVLLLTAPKLTEEMILISEAGIGCERKGEQLWFFPWEEIDCLRESRANRVKNMNIICQRAREHPGRCCFDLGKDAKQALDRYCKVPIEKWRFFKV